MNSIQSLIDRQLGIHCHFNYDSILKRLVVEEEESFYGLQGAGQGAGPVLEADPPIFACRFAECGGYEHILALANEDGRVAIQNTFSQRTASVIESFQCHNNAVFDLVWMPGSMNFVTVSGDHTACLWELSAGAARRVQAFAGHSRSVKAAAGAPGGAVFATGARDGHVLVWDVRAPPAPALALALAVRPDNRLAACHACSRPRTPHSHSKRARTEPRAVSVTGLAFQDERTLLSCGECDGNIKAWDLRKNYSAHRRDPLPRSAIPYAGSSARNGYSNLLLDAARVRLYASCMDHVVYCFNVATYSAVPERRYLGHENSTFYIKTSLSPDGRYLVSGSTDKSAYIWSVERPEPLARLAGHRAEVTCAAWCQRGDPKLVTCSDDARHKIWRIGPEETCGGAGAGAEGRAEEAPRVEGGAGQWGALERTPHAPRRPRPAEPARRRSKRCLADLMEGAGAGERTRPDEAPLAEERLLPAGVKRRLSASPPDESGAQEPEWAGSHVTPPRRACLSPARTPERVRVLSFGTPTRDLPDFVASGEAPHLRLMSPARKRRGRPDWLTELRREKRPRRDDAGDDSERGAAPAPAPVPVPKESAPARRTSVSDKTPRANRSARTLLKYFNVSTKK